mgnify:FL=1
MLFRSPSTVAPSPSAVITSSSATSSSSASAVVQATLPAVVPTISLLLLSVLSATFCPGLLLEVLTSALSCELLILGRFDFGSSFGESDRSALLLGEELGLRRERGRQLEPSARRHNTHL